MIDKLYQEIADRGITIYRLSQMTGIKYELVRRIFRSKRKLLAEELILILDKTGVALEDIK